MKFKFFLMVLISLIGINAKAIRHVGNGGGDAEMLLLKQYSALPIWLKSCQENGLVCPQFVSLERFDLIAFVSESDFQTNCSGSTLFVTNESLYLNQSVAKPNEMIFFELLNIINECFYNKPLNGPLATDIFPEVLMSSIAGVSVLKGQFKDYFVSEAAEENLNQIIANKMPCKDFRFSNIWSKDPLSIQVRCVGSGDKYLIRTKQTSDGKHLIDVKYFSDELFGN